MAETRQHPPVAHDPNEPTVQAEHELAVAIGVLLLLSQHEGGGPLGRIRYTAEPLLSVPSAGPPTGSDER